MAKTAKKCIGKMPFATPTEIGAVRSELAAILDKLDSLHLDTAAVHAQTALEALDVQLRQD